MMENILTNGRHSVVKQQAVRVNESCKTILYIAMSEDGFIAGENDNIDFLNPYQVEGEDYGYKEFVNSVGHIIVGRKTYEMVIGMGYPYHTDKIVYVATSVARQSENKMEIPVKLTIVYRSKLTTFTG